MSDSAKSKITNLQDLLDSNVAPGRRDVDTNRTRKVIITGGDSGIGRYTAMALAQDGCDVAITYNAHQEDAELTAEAVRHYGRKCYVHHLDLSVPENGPAVVDAMVKDLGGLDIFFNNAGVMAMQQFPNLELKDITEMFRINTFGAVLCIQRATRHMLGMQKDGNESTFDEIATMARKALTGKVSSPRDTPGRIIINTSVHEHIASPADTVYTMTKHALGGFIKCAAFALAGTGITINGVRPGEIATPLNDMHPEDIDNDRPYLTVRRSGHPTEIASMVKYLASDETSFINGMSYDVDGGMAIGEPMSQEMYQQMV